MTTLKVGLNGAGRIGRALIRQLADSSRVQLVAINDVASAHAIAHLTTHDSVHRRSPIAVTSPRPDRLEVGGRSIPFSEIPDPESIPWEREQVDVVVEATGRFVAADAARRHLRPSMRRVLISAVSPGADQAIVLGLHSGDVRPGAAVISGASCTTHAAALPLGLIDELYQVAAVEMLTVHCTTGSQTTIDAPHEDLRRGRSALLSMIPTTTTASIGLQSAFPHLSGKISCIAVRVPTAAVSIVELVVQTTRPLAPLGELRRQFQDRAAGSWSGLMAVSDEPLVSTDFITNPHSAIVDLPLLERPGDHLVRVFAWYDNEWGYSSRIADLLHHWAATEERGAR